MERVGKNTQKSEWNQRKKETHLTEIVEGSNSFTGNLYPTSPFSATRTYTCTYVFVS